ncbi:aspartyl/asparaginyl beta-hydroxylase domain-containing protein [Sphingomonas solaris]|uniref:Tetratricopeptide repeat protein n=1 Tax=Alterirhizorhabdus solaris TaxID=2529389 RepID=A0A558R543_9SPHN|nr:aspartyl/asparaginyl beta-hydroxylase domain-containing protein [Sphingomonas solaris]TVV74496.1 tetratricopeptide repeat protein [Sphingomonas solaris]
MSAGSPTRTLDVLFGQADIATREGRLADAIAAYRAILDIAPHDPRALNAIGNRLLSTGDATDAARYLQRAVEADPAAPPIWLNLSFALRAAGRHHEELAAIDRALTLDPYFLVALLHKAQWFERHDRAGEAVRVYRALLAAAPALSTLAPGLRQALEHGQALIAQEDEGIATAIAAQVDGEAIASERIRHCFDALAGRRRIYVQQPAGLHIPYLPAIQFFDRALLPWLAELEAATAIVRDEYLGLLAGALENTPYVQVAAGQPVNQWAKLNNSLDWGAHFLWRDGRPVPAVLERCPRTAALLGRLPLLDVPLRGPNVMFSTLRPHTHIPPHTGVTNMRAVVHLPLLIPSGCRFRVGSETRPWTIGSAFVFDDTIEHEAWNDSDEIRVVMILDIWNPFLDDAEKASLRAASRAISAFGGA